MSLFRPRTLPRRLALWQGALVMVVLAVFSTAIWFTVVAEEETDAAEVAEQQVAARRLLFAFATAVPIAIGLTIGAGYALSRRAIRPLRAVIDRAHELGAGRLELGIDDDVGAVDEVRQLVGSLNAMLARLDRSVDGLKRFTADASHELRHPLTTSMATLELALRAPTPTVDELQGAMGATLQDLRRMTRLVDILLTFARADGGGLGLAPARVSLAAIADDIVSTFASAAAERDVTLVRAAGAAMAVADAGWVSVALSNVVDNACKMAREGGDVTVTVGQDGARAWITVVDDGPGIDRADRERVFDRFFRATAVRSTTTGFGIGLALARDLVIAQGGTLVLDETTTGASFTIALPTLTSA